MQGVTFRQNLVLNFFFLPNGFKQVPSADSDINTTHMDTSPYHINRIDQVCFKEFNGSC